MDLAPAAATARVAAGERGRSLARGRRSHRRAIGCGAVTGHRPISDGIDRARSSHRAVESRRWQAIMIHVRSRPIASPDAAVRRRDVGHRRRHLPLLDGRFDRGSVGSHPSGSCDM